MILKILLAYDLQHMCEHAKEFAKGNAWHHTSLQERTVDWDSASGTLQCSKEKDTSSSSLSRGQRSKHHDVGPAQVLRDSGFLTVCTV